MILLIDNYDSFTYNLVDYFNQLGVEVKVLRNDTPQAEFNSLKFSGIVLSPGPERPSDAGNLLTLIDQYIGRVPMLGICLGHQAIAEYLGGQIVKAHKPMHGKISSIDTSESQTYRNLPSRIDVVRYHSLVVKDLPKTLKPTALTAHGELMSFESNHELKTWGIQFHPEAYLTQYGLEILKNWVTIHNIV
ncbi:anthranilate synthase component II [Roseivirga sp.]|uniref:anthranilate synthase component II n=1 Tax=Roseivirga sp. TaxID=1964215 RepID=UPI003B8B78C3